MLVVATHSEDLAARWRLSYLSWPIHHPCHKHATWLDTNTHSQQWPNRWAQFCSQKNDKEVSHLKGGLTQCNVKKSEREIASTGRLFIPINIFLVSPPDYVQLNTEINDIPCASNSTWPLMTFSISKNKKRVNSPGFPPSY